MDKKKLNLAVLMNMNYNVRFTKHKVWSGISQAAKDFNVNLYCIDGKSLDFYVKAISEQNLIYDMIDPYEFDGILIWTFTIGTFVTKSKLESFIDKFRSVPLVIGESCYGDIPSVHIDYQQMMDLTIGHLVKEHNYKKIALMHGPENLDFSQFIKQAYKKALSDYNIPFNPRLVSDPCVCWKYSDQKLLEMMKKRNLRLKDDIEAIITTRDMMTQCVYEAIQNLGKYMPYDVFLVGFSNNTTLKHSMPDVTYIKPSFIQMGYEAISMLRDICLGNPVEKLKKIPVELIPNESCGCQVQIVDKKATQIKPNVLCEGFNDFKSLKDKLHLTMQDEIKQLSGKFKSAINYSAFITQLIEVYAEEFYQNSKGIFFKTFDTILFKIIKAGGSIDEWRLLCTAFKNKTLQYMLTDENVNDKIVQMEKIWHKIFLLISESKLKAKNLSNDRIMDLVENLNNFSDNYMVTVDLNEFIKKLADELTEMLGIKNGYLVLFDNHDIRPGLNDKKIKISSYNLIIFSKNRESRKKIFNTTEHRQLFVPAEISEEKVSNCFMIKPLFFRDKKMGFLALSAEQEYINIYERISRELSRILYRLGLFKNIREKTSEIIRQKKLLDIFFTSAPGRICMRDKESKIIRVNHAYANWYGFSHEDELIGKMYDDLLDKKTALNIKKRDKKILTTGEPVLDLEENLGNSWALTTVMPLYNEQNMILGIMEIARDISDIKKTQEELIKYRNHLEDLVKERTEALQNANVCLHEEITERIRIEEVLRTSDRQYRMLAETVQDGIMIIQHNTVIFANQILQEMIDYTQDELKKQDINNLLKLNNIKDTFSLQKNQKGKKYKSLQRDFVLKSGKKIWFDIDRKHIFWNSKPALLLTLHNITGRIKIEQDLENKRAKLEQENINLKSSIKERYRFGEIIGKSPSMQRVYELIVNAASADVNVLIVGESGTGKELIARTIHRLSPRKNNPFIPVNCASIPDTLFEREFFGHVKGAFTGADQTKPGFFDQANNGILLLDEVTELSVSNQAKLLRVLQDGEYIALGSTRPKRADVMVVAATNRNIPKEIKNGSLRKDFYYRIGVIFITVPPLRERKDDLPLLIEHIINNYKKRLDNIQRKKRHEMPRDYSMFPGKLVQEMYRYNWPGNIRELQNVVQRYMATGNQNFLFSSFSADIESGTDIDYNINLQDKSLPEILKRIEKKYINNTLQNNHFSVTKTAKSLKMPLRTLQRRLEEYGLKD